jgi:hypothetical protein
MQTLMFISREQFYSGIADTSNCYQFSNDPQKIYVLYRDTRDTIQRGAADSEGLISKLYGTTDHAKILLHYRAVKDHFAKVEHEASQLINRFFNPEFFLKRLFIIYGIKNKYQSQKKGLSLLGFYKQIKKQNRLLNMLDYIHIEKEDI